MLGDLAEIVFLGEEPRYEGHAASRAVGVLVRGIGLIHEIGHSVLSPLRSRGEISECIITKHSCAPSRESFTGIKTAKVSSHRTFAQLCLEQRGYTLRTAEGCADLNRIARRVIATHMIGAAGSVRTAIECEDNHTHSSALGAKNSVVGLDDSVGILDEILCILRRRLS